MATKVKLLIVAAVGILIFVGGAVIWGIQADSHASDEVRSLQSLLLPPEKNPVVLVNVEEGEMDFAGDTNVAITEQLNFTPEVCKYRELDWLDRSGRTGDEIGVYQSGYWRGSEAVRIIIGAGLPVDNIERLRETMSAPCSEMVTSRRGGTQMQHQRVVSQVQENEDWMGAYPAAIVYESSRTDWYGQRDRPGELVSSEFGAQVRVGKYDVSIHTKCECRGSTPPDARADLLSALHRQVKAVEAASK